MGQNQELRPSRQANLFTTYRVTGNWRVGAGFTATSQNEPTNSVASANRAYGYVKADAMVEHKISQTHTLKLNVDNIFDRG